MYGCAELRVGELGQGRTAPQGERCVQASDCLVPVAGIELGGAARRQGREPSGIDIVGRDVELVARRTGDDEPTSDVGLEGLAKLGDVDLDGMRRGPRRMLTPQQFDQPIDRDDLAHVHEEDRQDRALLRRSELKSRRRPPARSQAAPGS